MTVTDPVSFAPLTPLDFLVRAETVHRSRLAIVDGARELTYGEFGRRVRGLAGALRRAALKPGERVALLATNSLPMLEAHYAVPAAGGVMVPLNHRLSTPELLQILEHSGATLLIADAELAERARGLADASATPLEVITEGDAYERLCESEPLADLRVEDETALLSINYTSGTTGTPKGVMYHHRGAYLQTMAMIHHLRLDASSVYLWTLPMFHCHGWSFTWAVTAAGGAHVCLRTTSPDDIWTAIGTCSVTHLCAAPTLLISMLNDEAAVAMKGAPLRVATGGAPPTPTLLEELSGLGMEATHLYGLTETFGPIAICEWHPEWDRLDFFGRARMMSRQGVANVIAQPLEVVDETGAPVPPDGETMGEVTVRGNDVMLGYFRDEAATAEAFRGARFHTGDLAVVHPDDYIELRDRSKDVIVSGGENISSVEVEQALASHPTVLEVAVVPIPDDHWGERPAACVVLRPGRTANETALDAHVRGQLAGFKAPSVYRFRDDLPRTGTGKIRKFVLRQELEDETPLGPPKESNR
ncbi:MAG: AMP-binding protein [Actinomycetota bacterium]